MDVEVFLTSHNLTDEDVKGRTVVVIDVLRASASIITALKNGARAVVPVLDMEEASKIASNLDQLSYLLGGERGGHRIEGYHLGNSPLEYTEDVVKDRTVIITTTNGTAALSRARSAHHLLVASFLNAGKTIDFVKASGRDLTIVCAGRKNRVSLEDTLCAGLLLHLLWEGKLPSFVSDTAYMAYTQYASDLHDIRDALRYCNHAQWLSQNGFESDVDYCTAIDTVPVLPYYKENRLVLANSLAAEPAT